MNERVRMLNGYRVIYKPEYSNVMKNDNWDGFIYEHVVVAEKFLSRSLRSNEVVHHLDGNRSNNRKENLLVLERSQHGKLHAWLDKGAPFVKANGEQGMNSGKPTSSDIAVCEICNAILQEKQKKCCSLKCYRQLQSSNIPSKEKLIVLLENNSRESVGRMFGVSGNAVKKWMRKYQLIGQS